MAEKLDIEALKNEASELGIEFSERIGAKTLQERIDKFYDSESADVKVETSVEDTVEDTITISDEAIAVAARKKEDSNILDKSIDEIKELLKDDPTRMHVMVMKKIEREAKKTQIVKITMVDKIEASTAKSTYLSNGLVALKVPLDIWVELPNVLIQRAQTDKSLVNTADASNNPVRTYTYRYVVEFKDRQF